MIRFFIHIIFLLAAFQIHSQQLSAKVNPENILIGEPFELTYTIKHTPNHKVVFTPFQDEIEVRSVEGGTLSTSGTRLEILEPFKDSTTSSTWTGAYTVTVWDSGTYIIPGPTVIIDDSSYSFKACTIYANYMDQVDGVDLYDINEGFAKIPSEPFSFINFIRSNWWWIALILALLATYIFIRKRKNKAPIPIVKAMSLKERTLLAIDALEKERMWEKDMLKEHFVELSFILRSYLTSRYNLSLLEKTTYETKLLLTKKGLNDDTVDNIIRILSESDMVKFAKSKPDEISILRVSTLTRQIIAETSPLEFDNFE
jgi:hypothetical protein